MLLWYIRSLNGMLSASRRFGYVIRTDLGVPFFQVPSFSCFSIRRRFSSLFKTKDFTDGFQETPFLHFIMDPCRLLKSVIFFIFCSAVSQCWQAHLSHALSLSIIRSIVQAFARDFGSLSISSRQSALCVDHNAFRKTIGA